MDPTPPESLEAPQRAGEDFVHVDNPDPSSGALSDSIVNVADELRDEGHSVAEPAEMTEAPEELSRVVVLTCESKAETGSCDVYLVGTAHVSEESCREVEVVIRHLKPEVVFLELCASRVSMLAPQNLKVPTTGEMIEMWKKKHNLFGILYSWFLAKVASKLEVFPGSEFRVAYEEAKKYGAIVILGDRPVQVTLRRTWLKMPLWHKAKLVYSLIFHAVFLASPQDLKKMLEELDDVDMVTLVIQEMSKQYPTLMETLVHERDQLVFCLFFLVFLFYSKSGVVRISPRTCVATISGSISCLWCTSIQLILTSFITAFFSFILMALCLDIHYYESGIIALSFAHLVAFVRWFLLTMNSYSFQFTYRYMATMLHRYACEHSSVVAVIGRGHIQGIKKNWQQPVSMEDLLKIPNPKPTVSVLKIVASLGVGAAIISGIYLARKK
ncbi:unnamed protein product [Linum tenue]|uniref:TraB domain-containing protein n=1 Tax=Linum tenue TaxID=586396 RepID=A0AAV0NPS9_9ROSI|nr:unnamed protein product [Linum tenue]